MTIHDILTEAVSNLPSTKLSSGDWLKKVATTMPLDVLIIIRTLSKKAVEGVHTYPNIDSSLKDRAYSALKCDGEIYYLAISKGTRRLCACFKPV